VENHLHCEYSNLPSVWAYVETEPQKSYLSKTDIDRIIEMAWEDRTPFDAIKIQFNLNESDVKALMKRELKFSSYKLWRQRVEQCKTKHVRTRNRSVDRFKCSQQRSISLNKISKRSSK
jgi:uncharacterized protein (TIGR03643 family)